MRSKYSVKVQDLFAVFNLATKHTCWKGGILTRKTNEIYFKINVHMNNVSKGKAQAFIETCLY